MERTQDFWWFVLPHIISTFSKFSVEERCIDKQMPLFTLSYQYKIMYRLVNIRTNFNIKSWILNIIWILFQKCGLFHCCCTQSTPTPAHGPINTECRGTSILRCHVSWRLIDCRNHKVIIVFINMRVCRASPARDCIRHGFFCGWSKFGHGPART